MELLSAAAHRRFKDELYAEFSRITGALSNPKRLEMLDLLAQKERSVQELAREMGASVANASQHLQVLSGARLVEARRDGPYVIYRLAGDDVFEAWRALRSVAEARLSEVDALVERYLGERGDAEDWDLPELSAGVRDGRVVLLDVRPPAEFEAGHIPGARQVALEDVARVADSLPRDAQIVAYCRGPYCVFADEAVALLRERGFRASRLRIGYPDWKALDGPTEQNS